MTSVPIVRISPAGWYLAVCLPDAEPWVIDLADLTGQRMSAAAVHGWTRLVPEAAPKPGDDITP